MTLKYWQKVRVKSWFYAGIWFIVWDKDDNWYYEVKRWFNEWETIVHETIILVTEDNLEIIL